MTPCSLRQLLPVALVVALPHCSEVQAEECLGLIVEGVCVPTSPLCEGVDCSTNECTENQCDPATGVCPELANGIMCNFNGAPGICEAGECVDADFCAGVDCSDNDCTEDACDVSTGMCPAVSDGVDCDFDGAPGRCASGECEDAALCAGKDCSDGSDCTEDICDLGTGECSNPNEAERTPCDFGGLPGECLEGVCEDAMLCAGNACEDDNPCTNNDCNPGDGECLNTTVANETECVSTDIPGQFGACFNGRCACDPSASGSMGCLAPGEAQVTCAQAECNSTTRQCVDLPPRTSGSCLGGLGDCNSSGNCVPDLPF